MTSAEEAEYADVDGYTPMQHDKYMLPFKKYMQNASEPGKTKGEYLPLNIVNFYDFGEQKIQYYKQHARNWCSAYALDPIDEKKQKFVISQQKLAKVRGEAVHNLNKHHAQMPRWGDDTLDLEEWKSEDVVFEKIISNLSDARKDAIHQEPIRFVLENSSTSIFHQPTTKEHCTEFVQLLLEEPEIDESSKKILNHITHVIARGGYAPSFSRTPERLDARFDKHNDMAKTERAETETHIWTAEGYRHECRFHKDVPRFPVNKMYMHAGVLEASNQLIRTVFKNQTFSLELTVTSTQTSTGQQWERRWIAYNGYKKGNSNVYDFHVGLNVDIPAKSIKEIKDDPPLILSESVNAKHIQRNKVNRLKEIELLQLHVNTRKLEKMKEAPSVVTYLYNYTFWTFIATFYQLNAPHNGYTHGVHITLLHRLSEMVNEWQEEAQERLARTRMAQATVIGQNQILRNLIGGLNQRIRALPYRRSTLPKGDGGTWLIFGMNDSPQANADTDMFIYVNRLSSIQRESMERRSNLVKAQILRRYYQQAITEANAQGKKVLEYLYALPEVQTYLSSNGYTIQGKIAPGVFVLICKALPTGYPPQDRQTTAIVAWRTEMTALLNEYTERYQRFPVKYAGGVFHPQIQYYINSVLAHQNHNTRNPPLPIDMTAANQYQAGGGVHPYGRYPGASERIQSARLGQPQIQLETSHPAKPDSKLREEVDALRRTVNQLALMGPA